VRGGLREEDKENVGKKGRLMCTHRGLKINTRPTFRGTTLEAIEGGLLWNLENRKRLSIIMTNFRRSRDNTRV